MTSKNFKYYLFSLLVLSVQSVTASDELSTHPVQNKFRITEHTANCIVWEGQLGEKDIKVTKSHFSSPFSLSAFEITVETNDNKYGRRMYNYKKYSESSSLGCDIYTDKLHLTEILPYINSEEPFKEK